MQNYLLQLQKIISISLSSLLCANVYADEIKKELLNKYPSVYKLVGRIGVQSNENIYVWSGLAGTGNSNWSVGAN